MKLEFRIPILPNPGFCAQVRLFALSLRELGSHYATAKIFVSLSGEADAEAVAAENSWSRNLPVVWSAVPVELERADPYLAAGHWRYIAPCDADVVVMSDADTCVVRPFDDLLRKLDQRQPLAAGLQAHVNPFLGAPNEAGWQAVLASAGLPDVPLTERYSLDIEDTYGLAPPYFNYGFVAFNRTAFARVAPAMADYLARSRTAVLDNPFVAQFGLALALAGEGVPSLSLGHEFNCANDDLIVAHGLADLSNIRVIHYLRERELSRQLFLSDLASFDSFIATPKANAVTEQLRQHMLAIPGLRRDWQTDWVDAPSRQSRTGILRDFLGQIARRLRA